MVMDDARSTNQDYIAKTLSDRGIDENAAELIAGYDGEVSVPGQNDDAVVVIDGEGYETVNEALDAVVEDPEVYDALEADERAGVRRKTALDDDDLVTDGGRNVDDKLYDVPELSDKAQEIYDSVRE